MAHPTSAFLQMARTSERERKLMLSALGPSLQVRQAIDGLTAPFAKIVEDVERTQRLFARMAEHAGGLSSIFAEAERTRRMIEGTLGESSALVTFNKSLVRQQQIVQRALGPSGHFAAIADSITAINRSVALFPNLSATTAAIIETFTAEQPETAAPGVAEQSATWITALSEISDTLEGAVSAAKGKIDRRALLRSMVWLVTVLLAVYAIWSDRVSSDRTQASLDRLESADEEHQSETGQAHQDIEDALAETLGRIGFLSDQVETQLEESGVGAFYLVIRTVPMTEDRRYWGQRITWLVPDQEVEVVERSKKWLRVIAHDLETGETRVGWVLKKYLKRLD